jgi:hypothetical protein
MKKSRHIFALLYGMLLLSIPFVSCNDIKNDPSPVNYYPEFKFTEEDNELQITTLDNNLILTFSKDAFNEYVSEFNIINTLSVVKLPFNCQKDEFFSNNIWIIKPDNIKFDSEFYITLKYTHEEFAPDFNTNDLKIYKLKRDFENSGNDDDEQLLIRVSDMSLLDHCIQNNEQMYVSTKISEFGGFVLGREVQ